MFNRYSVCGQLLFFPKAAFGRNQRGQRSEVRGQRRSEDRERIRNFSGFRIMAPSILPISAISPTSSECASSEFTVPGEIERCVGFAVLPVAVRELAHEVIRIPPLRPSHSDL